MTPNNIHSPEILAPAGSKESLMAAVRAGADAVYFGASSFNARRNAENFSDDDFFSAVSYCHLHGVKAYITLNTIIKDSEKNSLLGTLRLIAESGADAVIVQDLCVAKLIKECCPTLPLHASTQMAVHNVSGAKMLEEMGFERVVLARENSYEEIKKICESTTMETELFIHGAHCMSVSGMCQLSVSFGGRSGNRGLCAQPCRLDFNADGRHNALSLKDMSLITHLNEIAEAGVNSLKIEGRMKRPEYVAAAVNAVKTKLAGDTPDIDTLKSVFSRSGFTDGYFIGKRTLDMFGSRTKDDVTAASCVLPTLRQLYKDERSDIAVNMNFIMNENESRLTMTDGEYTVSAVGDAPQKAIKASLSEEIAARNLLKLGGTAFKCKDLSCTLLDGYTLPASALNALRRECVEKLTEKRKAPKSHNFSQPKESIITAKSIPESLKIRIRLENARQLPSDFENISRVILPVTEFIKHPEIITAVPCELAAEISPLVYPGDEEKYLMLLKKCRDMGVKYAVCENLGGIYLARQASMIPTGGHMLNIINSDAANEYKKLGVGDITLSSEISFNGIDNLGFDGRKGFVGYGFMPLMRFRCCPMQSPNGCGKCTGQRTLKDRKNTEFTVLCHNRKYSTLLNSVPLYTGNMRQPKADFTTLYFTTEEKRDIENIITLFCEKQKFPGVKTAGMYDKVLE